MESLKSDVNRVPFLTESEFIWVPAVVTNVHNKGGSFDVDLLCCAGSDHTVGQPEFTRLLLWVHYITLSMLVVVVVYRR